MKATDSVGTLEEEEPLQGEWESDC
jgi:hypothetical protein